MASNIRKFYGEVRFIDSQTGPDTFRVTVEASTIKVAAGYILREFFKKAVFKGRDPYRKIGLTIVREKAGK